MYRSLICLLSVSILISGSFVWAQNTTGVAVQDTTSAIPVQTAPGAVVNSTDSTLSVPAQVDSTTAESAKDSVKGEAPAAQLIKSSAQEPTPTVELTSSEKENGIKSEKRSGIGLNIGVRVFYPSEVNKMLEKIWDEMKSPYTTTSQVGTRDMILACSFKFKGVIYPVKFFCIEPYAQILYGPKYLALTGDANLEEMLNLLDYSGGVDLWFKFSPQKRFSFKLGVGGFGCYDYINVSGDMGNVTFTGGGAGFNGLAGFDIAFSRVAINLDFIVPVGSVKLKRKGSFDSDMMSYEYYVSPYHYPKKLNLTGFEFRPGVTFQF